MGRGGVVGWIGNFYVGGGGERGGGAKRTTTTGGAGDDGGGEGDGCVALVDPTRR
jgi:hypothetical protein